MQRTGTLIPLQYADDICWLGMNCKHSVEQVEGTIPETLASRILLINKEKTEKYEIKKNGDGAWRKCKYLGTLLDTGRKRLAREAMDKIKFISKDRRLDIDIKMRAFNAYTSSVFLYNSETWTVNKTTADSLDSYHRRLMRNAINIRWPNKISTTELYNRTQQTPWSKTITKRRVRLYGHLMRLPEDTPVRKAMVEYDRPLKMARGAPKFTWNKNIENYLSQLCLDKKAAAEIAQDRKRWRALVNSIDAS